MNIWMILGIVASVLVVVGVAAINLVTANTQQEKETISCSTCGNSCSAESNCGLASCGAVSGGSCSCGR